MAFSFVCPPFDVQIICFGNINTGGTGKTSTILSLLEILKLHKRNIVVLLRGYKSEAQSIMKVNIEDGKMRVIYKIDSDKISRPYVIDKNMYITNHGAKGGDWFGVLKKGENYGWKVLGWGGKNYIGTKIGPKWAPGYTKPIHYWVPSIGISSLIIYRGQEFKEWNGNALITSLKDQSLRRIVFENNQFIKEEIIFKDKIGRIRDIELNPINGKIFLLGEHALWKLSK